MSIKSKISEQLAQRPFLVWRLVAYGVVGLMAASLVGSSYFIYTHIYQTLDLTNAITVLNSSMHSGEVDIASYLQTEEKIEAKIAVQLPPNTLRNVFVYTSSTSKILPLTSSSLPHAEE